MPKRSETSDSIAAAPVLARAFDSAVREGFKAIDPDMISLDLQVTISASVSGTVALDRIAYPFWIVARFEGFGVLGRVCFGDKELFVSTEVEPIAVDVHSPDGYAFWEWAAAMGKSDPELSNTEWCGQPDRVRAVTNALLAWFSRNRDLLANPPQDVIERLYRARLERQAAWDAEETARECQGRVRRAREAFRRKAYASVVELLAPIETQLSPAEVKQLALARKALSQANQ